MKRAARLSLSCVVLTGCLFGGSNNNGVPSDVGHDMQVADGAIEDGSAADGARDLGDPDARPADDARMDGDMTAERDMLAPVREPSAVCEDGTSSEPTGQRQYRLRVNTSDALLSAGYVVPTSGADVVGIYWDQWENGELWTSMFSVGSSALETELALAEATAVVSVPWFGVPGGAVTRRNSPACFYAVWNLGASGSLDCTDAWGVEVANLGGTTAVYFWFGADGTIHSMPADDLDPAGQQISVPWCVQDPTRPRECLPLEYGTVEARANRGPYVLLSDALGRAHLWDAVQNIDGSNQATDCVTPPTAPVPLAIQGTPVMFAEADVVRVGGFDYLVHQTAGAVRLHRLGADLQPLPSAEEQLPNLGLRTHFDAASDGTHVAAVAAQGADARIFAFGVGGGFRDIVINDDATFNASSAGVEILADQVAIVAGATGSGLGLFGTAVNAYRFWP